MKRVTPEDITLINEAYLACHTYSGAAAATGWSASTVKKYIIENYQHQEIVDKDEPIIEIPELDNAMDYLISHSSLCCLTDIEKDDMKKIWKAMVY